MSRGRSGVQGRRPRARGPGALAPLAAELRRAAGPVLARARRRAARRALLQALGIASRFVSGRRETSPEAMEVVEMVLSGVVNKGAGRRPHRGRAARGRALRARRRPHPRPPRAGPRPRGHAGARSTRALLRRAVGGRASCPSSRPVSAGPAGEAVNVNADEAALGLAARPARRGASSTCPTWTACAWAATRPASLTPKEARAAHRRRDDRGRHGAEGAGGAGGGRGRDPGSRGRGQGAPARGVPGHADRWPRATEAWR